jgi:putative ABC transport system permease protein
MAGYTFNLALKYLTADKFKSFITITCVAIAIGTLFSNMIVLTGARQSLQITINRMGADLIVVPKSIDPWEISQVIIEGHIVIQEDYINISLISDLKNIQGIQKLTPQAYVASFEHPAGCACGGGLFSYIVGFDPKSDFIVTSWLNEPLKELELDEAIIGCSVPAIPYARPGATIECFGQKLKVKSVLDRTGTGLDTIIFVTLDSAYRLASEIKKVPGHELKIDQNLISAIFVKVQPGCAPADVGTKIKLNRTDVNVIYPSSLGHEIAYKLETLEKYMLYNEILLLGISALLVSAVFSLIVDDRRRDIGLLRAMGATRYYIFKLVVLEITLSTTFAGALGIMVGAVTLYFLGNSIKNILHITYLWPSQLNIGTLTVVCLGLSAFTGLLASLYPVILSCKLGPYDVIRRGE